MKKAVKSSKKDGKGGPFMDAVKGMAHNVSNTVKKVGDTKIKDAVTGIAKAAALPITGPAKVAGMAVEKLTGRENAMSRGEGEKKGLLKQHIRKAMPDLKPRNPSLISKRPSPLKPREGVDTPFRTSMPMKKPAVMPKMPDRKMPLPGKAKIQPFKAMPAKSNPIRAPRKLA